MKKIHTIDAQAQKIGRISTQAAKILMGKTSTDYAPNKVADVEVHIINAGKADVSEKKKDEKIYRRYTGYPGGLIDTSLKRMIEKKGMSEAFRIAVKGMLPKNKLQAQMLKNLVVTE
jgi:large subunit ribosomal protein L13